MSEDVRHIYLTEQFAVLPAPPGYRLIEIDENTFDGQIDQCISEPKPVLGFVIRKQEIYFSVFPITAFDVHDDGGSGRYALIRPDGQVDYRYCEDHVFKSIHELKVHLLRQGAELAREMAQDDQEKEPAYWHRHARKLEKEAAALVDELDRRGSSW